MRRRSQSKSKPVPGQSRPPPKPAQKRSRQSEKRSGQGESRPERRPPKARPGEPASESAGWLESVLGQVSGKSYVPMPFSEIADTLGIPPAERAEAQSAVNRLLAEGRLITIKGDRICLPLDADLVTGVIRFRQSGVATLMPETGLPPTTPVQIRAEDTWVALHGDTVVVRLERAPRRYRGKLTSSGELWGRVIRILRRARETITGTLQRSRLYHYVIPDDPRLINDVVVPDPARMEVRPKPALGDKVVVRLAAWESRHLSPEGEVVEVLGRSHTPMAEYRAILQRYDLNPEFPERVLQEVKQLPARVGGRDLQGRTDLRQLEVFTIDPDDAKDFDDALSIEPLEGGSCRIGVHIADVSAYVRPGTALDTEARTRGNSTYLVGTVIPMLPHALSDGLCSLVEGEDRLTKTVFLTFSARGGLARVAFANSVIRSRKRLTYRQAFALLRLDNLREIRDTPTPPRHQTGASGRPLADLGDTELCSLRDQVRALWKVAERLRKRRMATGSLDLDVPEVKIFVDEQGYADRIERIEYDESHQLIEEFMLAANEAVARAMHEARVPLLHRVHDKPDPTKLQELREQMAVAGIEVGDLTKRTEVTRLLQRIREHPQAYSLRIQFLRSLKQAGYRATPDGHYGLNKVHYAHFTSPIRRYADLVVHRILDHHLAGKGGRNKDASGKKSYPVSDLEVLGRHLCLTEQNSTEAERDSVKLKLMEFFERELKRDRRSSFEAIVTEVRNHGLFIELKESMAFGLVHVSTMTDDLYALSPDGTALVGRRRRKRYSLGQVIRVEVSRVDRFKRQIDFRMVSAKA